MTRAIKGLDRSLLLFFLLGIPAFLLVAASGPLVPRIRKSRIASAFLDGVNAASLALMAAVTWQLGRASITDVFTVSLAAGALIVLLRFRINSLWLLLAGAAGGVLAHGLHHGIW